jgi:branched-chain amino acid aminotransferase
VHTRPAGAGVTRPADLPQHLHGLRDPFVWIADPDKQRRGIDLIVGTPQRIGAGSVDPRIKNYHWLDFVMGLFEAYERGGETVVLTDGRGHVTEGPGFNVFAVFGQRAVGTRGDGGAGVLEGISRRTAIELAGAAGYRVEQRELGWTNCGAPTRSSCPAPAAA